MIDGVGAPVSGNEDVTSGAGQMDPKLEYTRRLWDKASDWYRNADTKAQITLTLSGTLVGFVSALILNTNTRTITNEFSPATWLFFILFGVFIVSALVSSFLALRPRSLTKDQKSTTASISLWRFDLIQAKTAENFVTGVKNLASSAEIEALAQHVHELASEGIKKHRWTAYGFFFLTLAVLMLGAAAASYLVLT